jgi:hypothetical protein
VAYVAVGLVVVIALVPIAYLAWRFNTGGDAEGGGSLGRQLFGRDKDDWGPRS